MVVDGNNGRRSLGTLLRELAEGSAALVRSEVKLARLEMGRIISGIGHGTVLIAGGVVLALLGALAVIVGLILLIGDQWLPQDLYWLAAAVVLVLCGGVAAWFAKRGLSHLSSKQLAPDESVAALEEDAEWLKRQLTSGATSS